MEKFKNYGIGFLAGLSLMSLLILITSDSSCETQSSHVWEAHSPSNGLTATFLFNKVTGEVRWLFHTHYITLPEKVLPQE